ESKTIDAQGTVVESKTAHHSWEELRKHAEFPAAATTLDDATTTTPAGTFACKRYVVRDGDEVSTFYFAPSLPGPPVLFFTDKNGTRVMTSTMISSSTTGTGSP